MNLRPHDLATIARARDEVRAALGDDDDAKAFWDTLGMLTEVEEIADALLAEMSTAKAMTAALAIEIADMRSRQTRFARRAERSKDGLAALLKAAGQGKMERPRATFYFAKGREMLELAADFECPTDLLVRPPPAPPPEPDKDAILAAVKAGNHIEGARIGTAPQTFSVRTR